jgi:hypothetical protein
VVPSVSLEALGNSLAHLIHPHNEQDRSDEAEGMVQNIPSRCEEIIDGHDTSDALRNAAHLVGDAAVFGVEVVNGGNHLGFRGGKEVGDGDVSHTKQMSDLLPNKTVPESQRKDIENCVHRSTSLDTIRFVVRNGRIIIAIKV